MLRDFIPRLYQQTILGTASRYNTLVVLPTGLGKTAIAFLLAAQRLYHYPNTKILMLAPTKPLCEQHCETFQRHLTIDPEKIVLFTGSVSPEKREKLWKDAKIIISTPQGLENDTINRRVKLEEVSLLIFDEAHHATGDYSYVWLAKQYGQVCPYSRILALTASPGSDLESIKEICKNLNIEKVEVRTDKDNDVKEYLQPIKIRWLKVDFPEEFKIIQTALNQCLQKKITEVKKYGYTQNTVTTKGELLNLQGELQKKIALGEKDFPMLRSLSLLAEALKVEHALELLETQGIKPLSLYFKRLLAQAQNSQVKAAKNLVTDEHFKAAYYQTTELLNQNIKHPKIMLLKELITEEISHDNKAKIIIFTQFRDSAEDIVKELAEQNINTHIFVGQAKKNGLGFSQKQQKEILDQFRSGVFNILIATSVAEEGLDIPKVDRVIFYEPVPSAIRSIQRRGRTGRLEKGEVTVLMTSATRDEAYRWSSFHKEKRMYRNLETLKTALILQKEEISEPSQPTLATFLQENKNITILADHREKDNKIVKELIELGINIKTTQLDSADYILSGKVAVELKKIPDFVSSIIDGRLLEQTRHLKQNFDKSVLIIEGEEDIYAVRKVHPNAIRGMLASLALDFHLPILYTKNPKETASLLAIMAKREQEKDRDFAYHEKKPYLMQEQQEFFVSSLPSVGVQTARKILEHFSTIKNLVNTSKEELKSLEGIGEKTAERLVQFFQEKYKKEK